MLLSIYNSDLIRRLPQIFETLESDDETEKVEDITSQNSGDSKVEGLVSEHVSFDYAGSVAAGGEEPDDLTEDEDIATAPPRWHDLHLTVIYEVLKGSSSRWAGYFKILPNELDTPVFWTNEEREELQGLSLIHISEPTRPY